MVMRVGAIYRYPVKGLSAEKMERVALVPGECLPHDRRFAIALGSTVFDPHNPEWLPKTKFVMLMRDEKLALLQTGFDAETGVLTITENGRELLRGRLTEPSGCRAIAEFCANFLGARGDGPLRVVEAPGHAFADARRKPNATTGQYVSLINHASIAALETAMERAIDPIRFRANVYFDGASAWSEHDWIDVGDHPRSRAAAGGLADHQMCGDPGQSRSPRNAISTSSPPSAALSATSIWASTPRWWQAAKSPPATHFTGRPTVSAAPHSGDILIGRLQLCFAQRSHWPLGYPNRAAFNSKARLSSMERYWNGGCRARKAALGFWLWHRL